MEFPKNLSFVSPSNLVALTDISVARGNAFFYSDHIFLYNKAATSIFTKFGVSERICIPPQITVIETSAFGWKEALLEITFSRVLREIGERSFSQTGLCKVIIPRSVRIIKNACFSGCWRLTELIFEEESELVEMEGRAFSSCAIQHVSIPKRCGVIGKFCFAWCANLCHVKFSENSELKRIEAEAFSATRVKDICLPAGLDFVEVGFVPDDCRVTVLTKG
jgi:hypothetical protein